MVESKRLPAFGTASKRFAETGYHPKFESRPGTYRYEKVFPGCYELRSLRKAGTTVPSWQRQAVTGEYSRRLGFRGEHILKRSLWMKSVNGPGWQDIPSNPQRSVAFSKAKRFSTGTCKEHGVPGPGTYGKNHVPYTRLEEKSHAKGFSFCTVPPFERISTAPRSLNVQRTYHLPPNLYNIKSAIEELMSKRTSKKGPYQLFSVPRFPDIPPDTRSQLPLLISPSAWNHPKNAFKGKFLKCGKTSHNPSRLIITDLALAPKDPFDPGPSHYDPYPEPYVVQARTPFNSSVAEPRAAAKCGLSAPPGRYQVESKRKIIGDGMKSVFISKTKRGLPMPEKTSWFE